MILLTKEVFSSKHSTCRSLCPAQEMVSGRLAAARNEMGTGNFFTVLSSESQVV
jgi:hypothetical protein